MGRKGITFKEEGNFVWGRRVPTEERENWKYIFWNNEEAAVSKTNRMGGKGSGESKRKFGAKRN